MRPLPFVLLALSALPLPAQDMRSVIEHYVADSSLLDRHWSSSAGSAVALERERTLWEGRLKFLKTLDFAKLAPDAQVDYILMRNDLEATLTQLAEQTAERRELAPWLPFRAEIEDLTDARVNNQPLATEKAAGMLAPLAKDITSLRDKLKTKREKEGQPVNTPAPDQRSEQPAIALPNAYQAMRAAEAVDHLAESLKKWQTNYEGFLPEFPWWIKQPYDETAKALETYGKFLREEIAGVKSKYEGPLIGKAAGDAAVAAQLQREFIPYTAEELIAIGEREFAWCEAEMKKASNAMKLGDDWKAALAKVKEQHVQPGEQEAFVRAEGVRATQYVKGRELVTVPQQCEEWWGTRMLTPQEQKQIPYAAYSGHDMMVAFASSGMKHEDKLMAMRGNNQPFMRNVVPHEVIPGHHLQSYMAARYRPHRRNFGTPFLIEGWALYWEMRLYGLGYQKTPEDKIGALFWRMHRCARIIVSLKFHLGQMKPEEMVNSLVDRVGHEKLGATSEVRRFITGDFQPLYQAAYMIGGLQLMALHKELVGGRQMSELFFHDAVLKLGPIPVELIRASLIKAPLTADYKTQWRFDGNSKLQE